VGARNGRKAPTDLQKLHVVGQSLSRSSTKYVQL